MDVPAASQRLNLHQSTLRQAGHGDDSCQRLHTTPQARWLRRWLQIGICPDWQLVRLVPFCI